MALHRVVKNIFSFSPGFFLSLIFVFIISKTAGVVWGIGSFFSDDIFTVSTLLGFLWQDFLFFSVLLAFYYCISKRKKQQRSVIYSLIFHCFSFLYFADVVLLFTFNQRFSFFEVQNVVASVSSHVFFWYLAMSILLYLFLLAISGLGRYIVVFVLQKLHKKQLQLSLSTLILIFVFLGLISNIVSHGTVGKEGNSVYVLVYQELWNRDNLGYELPSTLVGETSTTLLDVITSDDYDSDEKYTILYHLAENDAGFFLDNYHSIKPFLDRIRNYDTSLLVEKAIFNMQKVAYSDYFTRVEGKGNKENLIVLFLESYTAVDSQRTSGLENNLPLFDEIQRDGITYTNFFSNANTSERAHISLLQGIEPLTFFKTSDTYYELFEGFTEPLGDFFNGLGYNTYFLSTASLQFLNQRSHLEKVGFNTIIGEEGFIDRPSYGFDAAADEELYREILEVVDQQTGSYFIGGQTISSHEPYNTPNGYTEEAMFSYVDQELFNFYQELKQRNFFDNGILLLVSDHRKREAPNEAEIKKYGRSAEGRIVATTIGTDITPRIDNSLYQHIDIFYSLKTYFAKGKVKVLRYYNDLFDGSIRREWGMKEGGVNGKFLLVDQDGGDAIIQEEEGVISFWKNPSKSYSHEVLIYLNSLYRYQKDIIAGKNSKEQEPIRIIAHRGDSEHFLGNSMEAFTSAKNKGVDGIEFDVSLTADGQLVVYHGPSLASTICDKSLKIYELTLEELANCPLKNGEDILTLDAFLEKTKGWFGTYVLEVKVHDPSHAQEQAYQAVHTVQKHNIQDKTILVSYNSLATYIFSAFDDIASGIDSYDGGLIDLIEDTNHIFFMSEYRSVTPSLLQTVSNYDKQYMTYTVNSIDAINRLHDMGVRLFMTDNVDMMKEWKRKKLENK